MRGSSDVVIARHVEYATMVRERIERLAAGPSNPRVLEVGSGAHGLIFFLGIEDAVGVDPLADEYRDLFPEWQLRATTVRGYGEDLPFPDSSFDWVISDNVIDHAEDPHAILAQMVRVLRPGGVFYFTVHVHHTIYAAASWLHGLWNLLGANWEIAPFADHTVHFTLRAVRRNLEPLALRILSEDSGIAAAMRDAQRARPRHLGDRLKRLFFKNARYEVIALKRESER